MQTVSVVGAAAVWDSLAVVEKLPQKGDIVRVLSPPIQDCLGGCAPNIAVGLQKLGKAGVRLHYPIGQDAVDGQVLSYWEKAGLDCTNVKIFEQGNSARAWQYMQEDGTTVCFSYEGVSQTATPDMECVFGEWVVVAPILNQFTIPLLEKAIEEKKKVVVTGICDERLLSYRDKFHAVLMNQHEAKKICECAGKKALTDLAGIFSNSIVYITCGREGSLVLSDGEAQKIPCVWTDEVLDVTGAGDAYTAGVVFALANSLSPKQAAYIGACCSSYIIEKQGGQTNCADLEMIRQRLNDQIPEFVCDM